MLSDVALQVTMILIIFLHVLNHHASKKEKVVRSNYKQRMNK